MNIQWYPGHMTKTRRQIEADLKNVDIVVEIIDARIPISSRNPDIDAICAGKPRLVILNRADQADPAQNKAWGEWFRKRGCSVLETDAKTGKGVGQFSAVVQNVLKDQIARWQERGLVGRPVRAMIVGVPNVGKSTFINNFAGQVRAKAADRPGVTRGKQWVTVGNYDLLDMPGVLWKKFDSLETATNLAFIGSIKDDILDIEELAMGLLSQMQKIYPEKLAERYKLSEEQLQLGPWEQLEAIGRKRGMLISGGEVNTARAAIMLVDEFRASKWGRITLEKPYQMEQAQEQEVQE